MLCAAEGVHCMNNLKVFHDSVIELPAQAATPVGLTMSEAQPTDEKQIMPLAFSLKIAPALSDELEAKVAKGEVISADELNSKYAVPVKEVNALVDWLKGQGFEVTSVAKD